MMFDGVGHAASVTDNGSPDDRLASLRRLKLRPSAPSSPIAAVSDHRRHLPVLASFLLGAGLTGLLVMGTMPRREATAERVPAQAGAKSGAQPGGSGVITAAGYVVARRRATVAAEITGRITSLPVGEGERVRRGDVLATLDDKLARADLATQVYTFEGRRAALTGVSAQLTDAELVNARTAALRARGFATRASQSAAASEQGRLRAALLEARSALSGADAQVGRMRRQLSNYVIRAPFDGVVIERNAQVGEIISPISAGGFTRTGLCTVVDMSSLELEIEIAESYISRVKVSDRGTATLDAYPDLRLPVAVTAVIPTVNRERATVTVRVAFLKRDDRVMPSMAAKVAFGS